MTVKQRPASNKRKVAFILADMDITLWLNIHKYKALEAALSERGSGIEAELNQHLDNLYEQIVPAQERDRINNLLEKEQAGRQEKGNFDRKLSVIQTTEAEATQYFKTDIYKLPHVIARRCALALQLNPEAQAEPNALTAAAFVVRERIDRSEFESCCEQWGRNPNITAAAAVDFDGNTFSFLTDEGWKSCHLSTAVKAANAAFRKEYRPDQERLSLFYARISGELTPTNAPQEEPGEGPTPTMEI
jgi:hypothetical protein